MTYAPREFKSAATAPQAASAHHAKARMVGHFEIKAKDDGKRTFEGVLSTSHIDLGDRKYRDIVIPGAFKRTLAQFRGDTEAYVPLVDTHSYDSIFNAYGHMLDGEELLTGKTLRYEKKAGGVFEVPEMKLNTQWQVIDGIDGERLLDRLRPGSVRKMSMGYNRMDEDYVELKQYGQARTLLDVDLVEGSLVLFPMNPAAGVNLHSVKSVADLMDALRSGTLSPESLKGLLDGLEPSVLTDDDKRELRALASRIGTLLRPLDPGKAVPVEPESDPTPDAPPTVETPPVAATQTGDHEQKQDDDPPYLYQEALAVRLRSITQTLSSTGA